MTSLTIAKRIMRACDEKKAMGSVLLDIRKLSDVADYFVVVHGTSTRHVKTIAEHVIEMLESTGEYPLHQEGLSEATWVLVDYGSVILHVFHHETRQYYNLERLWGDAQTIQHHETRSKKARRQSSSARS